MLKIRYLFYLFPFVLGLGLYKFYTNHKPKLYDEIKLFSQEKLNIQLDFKDIYVNSISPLGIGFSDISIKKNTQLSLKAKAFEIKLIDLIKTIISHNKQLIVKIKLSEFNISLSPLISETKNEMPSSKIQSPSSSGQKIDNLQQFIPRNNFISDLNLQLELENGTMILLTPNAPDIQTRIEKSNIYLSTIKSDILFDFKGSLLTSDKNLNIDFPLAVSSHLELNKGWFRSKETTLNFMGIESQIFINYHLDKKYIDLKSSVEILNLNSIPYSLIKNMPVKKLIGSLQTDIKIVGYLEKSPLISGNINLNIISGSLEFKRNDISTLGTFKLILKTKFEYLKNLSLNDFNWDIDLTPLYFEKSKLIKKPTSTVFLSKGSGSYNGDLSLNHFNLQFDDFLIKASGFLSPTKKSNFTFELPEFNLAGVEKFLTFLPQYPINGTVEAKGEVQGYLNDPKNLSLKLEPFRVSHFSYILYKTINDVVIEGPIKGNILGIISIKNQVAEKGDIKGSLDAQSLTIKKNGESLKIKDEPLKIDFATIVKDKVIQIPNCNIKSLLGHLNINGRPPLSLTDNFELNIILNSMNWDRIRNFLPKNELLTNIKTLTGNGKVNVKGRLNPSDLKNSEVKIMSQTQFNIGEVKLPWDLKINTDNIKKESKNSTPDIESKPFLESIPFLRNLTINNTLHIDKIIFKDNQTIEDLNLNTTLKSESLIFTGAINKFFAGTLNILNMTVPLTTADPKMDFKVHSKSINLGQLIASILPEYKEIIKGSSSLNAEGSSYLPSSLKFKKGLFVKGDFKYENGRIESFNFINLIKSKLVSNPVISTPIALKENPLEGIIVSSFILKDTNIIIESFLAKTKRKEEISIKGTLSSEMNANLTANLKLTDLPLKGDFISANKDSEGFIHFPIEIKGNLQKPEWSFLGNTLDKMIQNYLQSEKSKVIASAKSTATRVIQSEIEKQKKNLEEDAKKKLQGLFK